MRNDFVVLNPMGYGYQIAYSTTGTIAQTYWAPEHEEYLNSLVATCGPDDWITIATYMNSHFLGMYLTADQCKQKWLINAQNQEESTNRWSEANEAMLIFYHMKYKNKWVDICNKMKSSDTNLIKNHFYSVFRKVRRKIKHGDMSYGSELELLEIYYIISLMEESMAKPLPVGKPKPKRGKDFIYTLMSDINPASISVYKAEFIEKNPLKDSIGSLLNKVIISCSRHEISHIKLQGNGLTQTSSEAPTPLGKETNSTKEKLQTFSSPMIAAPIIVPKAVKPIYTSLNGQLFIQLIPN